MKSVFKLITAMKRWEIRRARERERERERRRRRKMKRDIERGTKREDADTWREMRGNE